MPSKIWIPTIGDRIKLTADWTFQVTTEHRNADLIRYLKGPDADVWDAKRPTVTCTLPVGTVLKIDRIYIRGSYRDFDSITFRVQQCPGARALTIKKFGGTGPVTTRFFAKLADVNMIEAEPFSV